MNPTRSSRHKLLLLTTTRVALVVAAVFVLSLLTPHLSLPTAFAAACTNSYASGAAAPVGYAVAWNPLTAARELLVQGTDCTTSTATMKVGSGAATQFVYNKGYYYTGSAWKEYTLTGTSALQSNAWYTGSAQASVNLPQTLTYVVGYVCQREGSTWKCGCRDTTCATAYWQLQAVKGAAAEPAGGGSNVGTGPQCAGATPPPAAQAAGLTKLDFCDDFSDPGTLDFGGTGNPGFKWYRNYSFPFSPKTSPSNGTPASDYTFKDGILEIKQSVPRMNLQSAISKNGQAVGYYIDREVGGWYFEAKLSHAKTYHHIALWSMDMCHLYNWPKKCTEFVEPDFYEYFDGNLETLAAHRWTVASGPFKKAAPSCINTMSEGRDTSAWIIRGALATPGGYSFYRDDVKIKGCDSTSWKNEIVAGPSSMGDGVGRYPILISSGKNQLLRLDYVRVWVKP